MKKLVLSLIIITLCIVAYGAYESTWQSILNKYSGQESPFLDVKADSLWPQLLHELKQSSPHPIPKKRKFDMVTRATPKVIPTQNRELAFWLNSYNIAVVNLLITSKNQVVTVNKKVYSPEQIGDDHLRPWGDPRVHFAMANVALEKLKLPGGIFSPELINEQLQNQMNLFLDNSDKGLRIDKEKKIVFLSTIFNKYESDFIDVRIYLSQNMPKYSKYLLDDDFEIRYLP